MKQIFENILKVTVGNLFHSRNITSNSHNNISINGPVYFVSRQTKITKHKIKSLSYKTKEISKL